MTTTAARSCLNLPAPAKLNLFLHVIGQRSDGKHLLESIFILINLFDTIDLIERFDGQLERTGDIIGAPEKDLCIRAAKALLTAAVDHGKRCCGQLPGATIHVQKRIPAGAGMGGASLGRSGEMVGGGPASGSVTANGAAAGGPDYGAKKPHDHCGNGTMVHLGSVICSP